MMWEKTSEYLYGAVNCLPIFLCIVVQATSDWKESVSEQDLSFSKFCHTHSLEFKSGLWLDPSNTWMCFNLNHSIVVLATCSLLSPWHDAATIRIMTNVSFLEHMTFVVTLSIHLFLSFYSFLFLCTFLKEKKQNIKSCSGYFAIGQMDRYYKINVG